MHQVGQIFIVRQFLDVLRVKTVRYDIIQCRAHRLVNVIWIMGFYEIVIADGRIGERPMAARRVKTPFRATLYKVNQLF